MTRDDPRLPEIGPRVGALQGAPCVPLLEASRGPAEARLGSAAVDRRRAPEELRGGIAL